MKGGSDPYKLNHFLKESIYVNCFNRLRFLAEVSTKLHKMHFFGQFKDRNSERKHGKQIYNPNFSSNSSVLTVCDIHFYFKMVKIHFHVVTPLVSSGL